MTCKKRRKELEKRLADAERHPQFYPAEAVTYYRAELAKLEPVRKKRKKHRRRRKRGMRPAGEYRPYTVPRTPERLVASIVRMRARLERYKTYTVGKYATLGLTVNTPCIVVESGTGQLKANMHEHIGERPHDAVLCHRCDNHPCVNPEHLFWGTPQDNMRDMQLKGRGRVAMPFSERVARLERRLAEAVTAMASLLGLRNMPIETQGLDRPVETTGI